MNGSDTGRLGLAISKKHCRLASARTRLKRIVRESFRQHHLTLAGIDVVVLAQSGTAREDNRALFDSLAKHWQKTRSANLNASDNRR
jgi:ribonuclease P protein component